MAKAPNRICKYSGCKKEYYACDRSLTTGDHWKSMACCPEHYQAYLQEVFEARKKPVEILTNNLSNSGKAPSDEGVSVEVESEVPVENKVDAMKRRTAKK